MNLRTLRSLAILAIAALATVAGATETRRVSGYILDSDKPNLKQPREFNLDGGTEVGVVPSGSAATVAVLEEGNPFIHQTTFTITAASATITDATTAGAHGGIQLYDFPEGLIQIVASSSDLAITAGAGGIADTASVVCSLGSVVTATDNATLTSTEITFGPSTAATLSGGVGACDIDGTTAITAVVNGSATASDLFLDFAIPDAGVTDGQNDTIAVTGAVTVTWIWLGDN